MNLYCAGDTGDGETQVSNDPFKNDDSGGGDIMDDSPMPFGENQDANIIQDVEMEDGVYWIHNMLNLFQVSIVLIC